MKNAKLFGILNFLILVTMVVSGCVNQETGRIPTGTPSVSQLLEDPVYDTELTTYGKVSLLGELFCPCFELTSGGKSVEVWYDLVTEGEGKEWPAVSVEGIENGDWVMVTGQLRPTTGTEPSRTFWAKGIQKTEP